MYSSSLAMRFRNTRGRISSARTGSIAALVAAGLISAMPPAHAEDPLGNAVAVRPAASSQLGGSNIRIINGADLYEGQVIATGSQGQVQILFTDDTHMVVGPSSKLVLETYLMRNSTTVSSFAVKALGGTYRFVTGKSAKNAYKISSPTGTIGVRGTEFDFSVNKLTGETQVALFKGLVRLCPIKGECVTLSKQCEFGTIQTSSEADVLDPSERSKLKFSRRNFPYILSQTPLRVDFRIRHAEDCRHVEPVVASGAKRFSVASEPPAPPPPPDDPPPPDNPPPPPPPDDPPPPPPPPPPSDEGGKPNKGIGNGGESDDGGPTETQNPRNENGWKNSGQPNKTPPGQEK